MFGYFGEKLHIEVNWLNFCLILRRMMCLESKTSEKPSNFLKWCPFPATGGLISVLAFSCVTRSF